ncbi:MAG: hypothetical protein JNM09_20535 [Blastocatellia bacterium]|nr:hypothetical protein [Blastocatellia bacterium]
MPLTCIIRITRKVLAPMVTVFLNLQRGRDSLDLDGLVMVGSQERATH